VAISKELLNLFFKFVVIHNIKVLKDIPILDIFNLLDFIYSSQYILMLPDLINKIKNYILMNFYLQRINEDNSIIIPVKIREWIQQEIDNKSGKLLEVNNNFRTIIENSFQYYDVELNVKDYSNKEMNFKSHKSILAYHSKYFELLFNFNVNNNYDHQTEMTIGAFRIMTNFFFITAK